MSTISCSAMSNKRCTCRSCAEIRREMALDRDVDALMDRTIRDVFSMAQPSKQDELMEILYRIVEEQVYG